MNNLAVGYWATKRLDRSIPLFEETLKLRVAKSGTDHPDTWIVRANLGVNYGTPAGWPRPCRCSKGRYRASREHPHAPLGRGRSLLDAYVRAGQRPRRPPPSPGSCSPKAAPPCPRAVPNWPASSPGRGDPPGGQGLGRGRADPARVPGHPREGRARRLDDVQHEVDARRGPARPEEIRRGRAAPAIRLRGDEDAGRRDPAAWAGTASARPSTA